MSFVVELAITNKCNLGCPYCYVANTPKFMNIETFEKSLKTIHEFMKKTNQPNYFISFFGGEPLLNFELIKYAIPLLQKDNYCNGYNIISNMTLIDNEKYKWLKENHIGISWSFDGLSSNESRPLLKMKENGNYKKVLDVYNDKKEMILDLCNKSCKVMIYPGNCKSLVENFKFLREWGITFPDFSLVRDAIWTNKDVENFKNSLYELTNYYIETILKGEISSIGFYRLAFLDSVFGLTKGKRQSGCFACVSGCTVTPTGKFFPCQRFASKNVLEYTDNFNFKFMKEKLNPCNYEKCKKCDLYQVCNAGCSFSQILNDNQPIDCICELYHIIYEETFRLLDVLKNNKTFKQITEMWLKSL